MQKIIPLFFALFLYTLACANTRDSIVQLPGGIGRLVIPQGFKFVDKKQVQQPDMIGVLYPADSSYSFIVNWKPMGYVKDENANRIDYDKLLANLQQDEEADNVKRMKMGYPAVHLVKWAEKPYYDPSQKVLHWAKEVQSGQEHTLNYSICILGRKGILSMNAVGNQLPQNIDKVLGMAKFAEGHRHTDFDPAKDNVAGWTIGSLVTGKAMCKASLWGLSLKYMLIGLVAAVAIVTFVKDQKRDI